MENLEEQAMELEALESIFMDDFTRISDICCKIFVQPFSSSDSDEISHVSADFTFIYPIDYPSVIPDINIGQTKGLSEAQKTVLVNIAKVTAEECIGSAMIYNIIEAVKAWMVENNVELLSEHELIVRRKLERSEMKTSEVAYDDSVEDDYDAITDAFETQAVQHGTMVTVENFSKWKKQFDEKIKEKWRIEDEENMDPEAAKRITGKRYFEMNASSGFLAAIELECEKQQTANADYAEFHNNEVIEADEKSDT